MSAGGPRFLDYFELLLAVSLWGSLYPASKLVLVELSATQLALARASIAFLVLGTLVLIRGKGREAVLEAVRNPLRSGVLGILSFVLSSILAIVAVRFLPASVVGMIIATSPLWLSLAVIALRRPNDSWRTLSGAAVALAGVGLVLFRDGAGISAFVSGGGLDLRGVASALLCAVVIAVQAVWGRRIMPGHDPMVLTCLGCGWSLPILAALVALDGGMRPGLSVSEPVAWLLLYVGVGCTAVTFPIFNHALQRVSAERAASFQYLVPFVSALLAFAFLGEKFSWQLLAGGLAIILGLIMVQKRGSTERAGRERPLGETPAV